MSGIDNCGPGHVSPIHGIFTSTATILVLYILLVIILRAPLY
ncbi:sporulation protein YjcZ [Paenibacillus puldeungensis]|uniref:Sporulation protein YjcZ n=1 Tax=Paenibacillus puldeungensis TaxID=696536 RepID=A0ABW3S2F7_9BACL